MGGVQCSILPDETLCHADAIVLGDAESVWPQVLKDFSDGQMKKVYRDEQATKTLVHVPPRRDIFRKYKYFPNNVIETGRGCPHTCDFCTVAAMHGGLYKKKSIPDVVRDIESLSGKDLYIADDNFVANQKYVIELCKAIAPYGLHWVVEGSILMARNPELMRWMAKAGCVCILNGFESLNPETLKLMGKSWTQTVRTYEESIRAIRDHGISIYGSFVLGYDTDTADDIERTVEFAIEQKLALASFNQVIPFPGTNLYRRLEAEKRLLYDKWWLDPDYFMEKPIFKPGRMAPEALSRGVVKARMEFYRFSNACKRFLDFGANMRNLINAYFFFRSNFTAWKDTVVQDN